VRQVLKRVCLVLRERVRLEVGVVVGLEGTFGRGRTCGSSVSAAVTDDSGRGGSRTKLGDCDIFLKNLVPKSKLFGLFGGCRPRGRPSGRPSRATSGGVRPKVHWAV